MITSNKNSFSKWFPFLLLMLAALWPEQAFAHQETGTALGFSSGFMHPISGYDHVIAMVAVGLWGGQLGRPAIWLLPVTFPIVMAFGGMLGIRGVPLPGVETGIALSDIILGAMIAFNAKPKLWIAAVIVGIFAIFHGYAHGVELPNAANPLAYAAGFVIATGLLHVTGILIGMILVLPWGMKVVRVIGTLISLAGFYFLYTIL
jgi:urease accessory protein